MSFQSSSSALYHVIAAMFTRSVLIAATLAVASAFQHTSLSVLQPKVMKAGMACEVAMQADGYKKAAIGLAALPLAFLLSGEAANALTASDLRSLTYQQLKGTGIANRCPEAQADGEPIKLDPGSKYKITDLCLEPKSFQIEEETVNKRTKEVKKGFVDTKLLTRATYSLSGVEGPLFVDKDGQLTFVEKEGMDYAAATVQMPGGERVPFLFTIKELVAKSSAQTISAGSEFGGYFKVPSYRSGLFLDPKNRGGTTGYDMAVALPALEADGVQGQNELFKENNKVFQVSDGTMEFAVNKADADSGEFSGVFVSEQLTDSDMGAKAPKKLLLKGIIYGKVAAATLDDAY